MPGSRGCETGRKKLIGYVKEINGIIGEMLKVYESIVRVIHYVTCDAAVIIREATAAREREVK